MATQTILCNENNDMYLPNGRDISMVTGGLACAQNLKQRSLERLGENQYNTTEGIDYFGTIFTPQPNYDAARRSISQNLLACPDVLNIDSLIITTTGDVFSFVANVHTIYGPVNVEV
jgi:hypothetical protein